MRTALNDASVVQHHDSVGVFHSAQPVCDDKHRAARHQRVHAPLYNGLGAGVDGAGRLVQDHHGRVRHRRTGNGQQLSLALGQACAVAAQRRIIALRQACDEIVRTRQLGRGDTLLVTGVQAPVANVVHHRSGEQVGILQHNAQAAAQVCLFYFIDIDAVIADLAVRDIVKTVDEIGDGRLARAGGAHKSHLLAGLCIQRHIMQHRFAFFVGEIYVKQTHIAGQAGIGGSSVAMRMLPGPYICARRALLQRAVRPLFRVHQRHIALVGFRLLVDERKNALRAGQAHDDGIDLIGHLADIAGKLLRHVQKRHHDADAERQA